MIQVSYRMIVIGILLSFMSCSRDDQAHRNATHERPLPVIVGSSEQRDVPIYIEAIGHVTPMTVVDIRPQVAGTIIEVAIKGGQSVRKGDLLYRIDPAPYQYALDRAEGNLIKDEAQLEYAKQRVERYTSLVKKDFISKITLEEFIRDVKSLQGQIMIDKAEINLAKHNLRDSTIVSPLTGRISLSSIDVGNVVTANDPNALTRILQMTPIYIDFTISQKDFQELQRVFHESQHQFCVLLPYGEKKTFEGKLTAINNTVNLNTGTIQLRGMVQNEEEFLWPGEFVQVNLLTQIKKNATVVPLSAVQRGQKGPYIYVLKPDETVEALYVKTGEILKDWIVVDEGLEPNIPIITDGQLNLKPGAKVKITNRPNDQTEQKSQEGAEPS